MKIIYAKISKTKKQRKNVKEKNVANIKSAKKRIKVINRQKNENKFFKASVNTAIKKYRKLISEGNLTEAENKLKETVKLIQSCESKGIYHKNNASRKVARLSKALHVAKLSAGKVEVAKPEVKEEAKPEVKEVAPKAETKKAPAKKASTTTAKKATATKTTTAKKTATKTTAKKATTTTAKKAPAKKASTTTTKKAPAKKPAAKKAE